MTACKRMPFRTRKAAVYFIHTAAYPNRVTGQIPVRAYHCPVCRQWHVTSKPGRNRK